jgi:hypothetical protein
MKKTLLIILTALAAPLTITAAASTGQAGEEEHLKNMKQRIDQVLHAAEKHTDKSGADIFIKDLNKAKGAADLEASNEILKELLIKLSGHCKAAPTELMVFENSIPLRILTPKMVYSSAYLSHIPKVLHLKPSSAIRYVFLGDAYRE